MPLVIHALGGGHTQTLTNAFWESNLYKSGDQRPQAGTPGLKTRSSQDYDKVV